MWILEILGIVMAGGGGPFFGGFAAASAEKATPILPGELTVSSSVTIEYILNK